MQQNKWLTIFICLVLTGCQTSPKPVNCQILPEPPKVQVRYSHYYLWIKSLNSKELSHELEKQLQTMQSSQEKFSLKLIMLYSLPNSPVHNPYTAKAQLNNIQLAPENDANYNTADLAFILMLKDQLNQQLLQLEKIANYKSAYRQSQKVITSKQLKISQLNQQLIQLKQIEKNISERGQ